MNSPTWADQHAEELKIANSVSSVRPPSFAGQGFLELQAPRTCNTGALISSAKIDWLEFTVSGVSPDFAIREYLALDPALFTELDYGMHGYSDPVVYGSVKVLHSQHKPERGTKIILSGTALDEVGRDAVRIISLVLRDGGTFARIDLAIDDKSGSFSLSDIEKAVLDGKDVNRFSQFEVRKPVDRRSRKKKGHSIYWGSPSSSRQVVIYDKELERFFKVGEKTGSWVRCEVRWKKRAALIAAVALAENGLLSAGALVRGVLDFRELDNDNESRRSVCSWWASWIGSLSIIRTGIKKKVKTIQQKAEWVSLQVKKTLGQIYVLMDRSFLPQIIKAGVLATSEKEWAILDPLKPAFFKPDGSLDFCIPF